MNELLINFIYAAALCAGEERGGADLLIISDDDGPCLVDLDTGEYLLCPDQPNKLQRAATYIVHGFEAGRTRYCDEIWS
jgi:hypothetical protein